MQVDIQLPKIDDQCDVLPVDGQHGLCRAYYQPDELDIKTIEYARTLAEKSKINLHALDLGCSPYFPQSQRLAKLGFQVDAFDLEKPFHNLKQINQQYQNRINYHIKNIADITSSDLRDDYQIIYSNRCLSFLTYPQTRALIEMLIKHIRYKTRYFLAFFAEGAEYAENYPIHLPLENRYLPLNNSVARSNAMLAPVCVYKRNEIFDVLLNGLPISIIEELHTLSGSIKIIFEKK